MVRTSARLQGRREENGDDVGLLCTALDVVIISIISQGTQCINISLSASQCWTKPEIPQNIVEIIF